MDSCNTGRDNPEESVEKNDGNRKDVETEGNGENDGNLFEASATRGGDGKEPDAGKWEDRDDGREAETVEKEGRDGVWEMEERDRHFQQRGKSIPPRRLPKERRGC